MSTRPKAALEFELPGGGEILLQSQQELDLLEASSKRLQAEFNFEKTNDKVLLGALLSQHLTLFRAQQRQAGMEMEYDAGGQPTGRYKHKQMKPAEQATASKEVREASAEIRALEAALGIDKKTRDASGAQTTAEYLGRLKRAAAAYGIHIDKRVKMIEGYMAELSTKIRMLDNADPEDRAYHNITEQSVLQFARDSINELAIYDKQFSQTQGHLWRGKL